MLRALGVQPEPIRRQLVKEGLLLGAAGIVLGIPLGIGVGRIFLPMITGIATLAANLAPPVADPVPTLASLALAAAMGFVVSLLAALLPAWRAAQVSVLETVRGRGREQRGAAEGTRRGVRAVVGAGIVLAIAMHLVRQSALWGLAATALIAVGTALAARPLIDLARRPFVSLLGRIAGPSGRFAAAHVFDNPRRAASIVGVMGVGLGSVLSSPEAAREPRGRMHLQ